MAARPEPSRYCDRARELGATGAKAVPTGTVVTAPWVRWKCQFGCGGYGSNLCCPPHSPTPEQTRCLLDSYNQAVLIHCAPGVDVRALVVALEREAFLDGWYKAFGLAAGPCGLCGECPLTTCKRPYDSRPAMEACGIDVFATARTHGFPIEVVTCSSDAQNYYGLLLVD